MSQLSTAPRRSAATGARVTRLYSLLLRLAPRGFREEHGAEVAQVFRQLYRDAWAQRGVWGALTFLTAALGDLLGGILGEYLALIWGVWNRSWVMSRLRSAGPSLISACSNDRNKRERTRRASSMVFRLGAKASHSSWPK